MTTLLTKRSNGLTQPAAGVEINWGHPLAQSLFMCIPMLEGGGVPRDLAKNRHLANSEGNSTQSFWEPTGKYGGGMSVRTPGSTGRLLYTTDMVDFPTGSGSVVIAKRKLDTTNRGGQAFAVSTNNFGSPGNPYWACDLPYSDGTVYLQFHDGGVAPYLLSASGLTFGDDLWVFTSGRRGQQIIQNGVLRASSSTAVTRGNDPSGFFTIGSAVNDRQGQDFCTISLVYVYSRELTVAEAMQLTIDPFCMLQATSLARSVPLSVSPPAVSTGFRRRLW